MIYWPSTHRRKDSRPADSQLHAYFDAGWACHSDMKGHSDMVLTLGHFGFPILYKSQKQKVVTRSSSTEVELVCMYSGAELALCYRRIGHFRTTPHCQSTRTILRWLRSPQCDTEVLQWLKQHIDSNVIVLHYLTTHDMIADFFASPRIGESFRVMRKIIMGTYAV
jgi:hypothetical protein